MKRGRGGAEGMEVMQLLMVGVSILVHQDYPSIRALRYLEPAPRKSNFFLNMNARHCFGVSRYHATLSVFSKSTIYQEVLLVVASTVIVYLYNTSKGNLPLDIIYREPYRFASMDSNSCATMIYSM